MKLHRFFVAPQSLEGRVAIIDDKDFCKQISKVLRLAPGDQIIFLDGYGFEYTARLLKISAKETQAEILKRQANFNEPDLKINLYQSLLKKDKMEWVFQKCTEVGVSTFTPIIADRSEKIRLNEDRSLKIIKEAAEQSERGIIPELNEIQDFEKAIRKSVMSSNPVIFLESNSEPIGRYLQKSSTLSVNIFVGPEGGWSERELDLARDLMKEGYKIDFVSLGERILRAETAGLAASAIILNF